MAEKPPSAPLLNGAVLPEGISDAILTKGVVGFHFCSGKIRRAAHVAAPDFYREVLR